MQDVLLPRSENSWSYIFKILRGIRDFLPQYSNLDTKNLFNEQLKVSKSIFPNGNVKMIRENDLDIFNGSTEKFCVSRFVVT